MSCQGKIYGKKTHKTDGMHDSHALNICVNSVYEKKRYLNEEPTAPHVVCNRFPFFLLNNTYGNKDKMGWWGIRNMEIDLKRFKKSAVNYWLN